MHLVKEKAMRVQQLAFQRLKVGVLVYPCCHLAVKRGKAETQGAETTVNVRAQARMKKT